MTETVDCRPRRWSRFLWRVRRKLTLSYVFVGVVPILLIVVFFLLCGLLLFFNVSSYLVQSRVEALVDETRFLAEATAIELAQATDDSHLRRSDHAASGGRLRAISRRLARRRADDARLRAGECDAGTYGARGRCRAARGRISIRRPRCRSGCCAKALPD